MQCARHRITHEIPGNNNHVKVSCYYSWLEYESRTNHAWTDWSVCTCTPVLVEARSQICKDEEVEGDGTTENSEHREGIKFQLWGVVE